MRAAQYLRYMVEAGASDLHIKVGLPPVLRADSEQIAAELLPESKLIEFRETNEADIGYSLEGVGRFRINVFRQKGEVGVAIRRVRSDIPNFDELKLPPAVRALAAESRGLVLITGPAGTGKTTTIASMIGWINEHRRLH